MAKISIMRIIGVLALTGLLAGCASHEGQVNDNYLYVPSRPPEPAPPAPPASTVAPPPAVVPVVPPPPATKPAPIVPPPPAKAGV